MKRILLIGALFVVMSISSAFANPDKIFSNQTSNATHTKTWQDFGRMSVSGTFDNVTTGAVYIKKSTNGGNSYVVLQGYSTVTSWNYDLDTTYGLPTNIEVDYTNKSKTVPRNQGNVWTNVK